MNIRLFAASAAFVSLFALPLAAQTAGQKQQESGAAAGALSGAAAGAVGGAIVGGPIGAAVGGAAGAAAGAITGSIVGSITVEDRGYVERYVTTRPVPSAVYQGEVTVGAELPDTVRYYRIDGNPRLETYRYTRVNNMTVVVDDRNRVVSIIQ